MTHPKSHIDYIIIGGGSAGCVLANRLSAHPDLNVCLIEAGPRDNSPFIHMPMGLMFNLRSNVIEWKFWTTPQPHCANREMFCPRGRTLGGSSSINAMCYSRGNPDDYNHWASLGCEGWSYQEVLPYFKKLENFEPGQSDYHGVGGPLNIAKLRYANPLTAVFIEAGMQAGYPYQADCNAESQEGVGYFHVMQKDGQRCSNARAYLHPIASRKNLEIKTNSHVSKIIFEGKRAIGVRLLQNKKEVTLYANKEIILSAGSILSPQILLLSGVGPRAEIDKHGLTLVHDLPGVGENLQDHLDIHLSCLDKTRTSISFRLSYLWRSFRGLYHYLFKRDGELTSNYAEAFGFTKSRPELPAPDLQWHFTASVYTYTALNLTNIFKYYGYSLLVCHLHPKSRGRITLRDANPLSKPLIDPNYLSVESDLDTMVTAFKKSREILAQKAFAPYFLKEFQPGDQVQTDDEIKDYIRKESETIYHPVGTCKMGRDAMSVVDPLTLKVHGIENLRVIDASIMPTVISGNTNAATTMIAEKGAEMILLSVADTDTSIFR